MTRIKVTLYEGLPTFTAASRCIILKMRNMSDKICKWNQNTHFVFGNFFLKKNSAVYEIMCKNIVERGRQHLTIRRISRWVPKATNTLSKYVIFVVFPLQQRLHERTSVVRYTSIALLVMDTFNSIPHKSTQSITNSEVPTNSFTLINI